MSDANELLGRCRRLAGSEDNELATAFRALDARMCAGTVPAGWQHPNQPVDDSATFPWAQDLDRVWHRRPAGDYWRPMRDGYEGPQCTTNCGRAINSAHVSEYMPEPFEGSGERLCTCATPEPASPRPARKPPLHQQALDAYQRGDLHPIGRAATRRPESDYQQDSLSAIGTESRKVTRET